MHGAQIGVFEQPHQVVLAGSLHYRNGVAGPSLTLFTALIAHRPEQTREVGPGDQQVSGRLQARDLPDSLHAWGALFGLVHLASHEGTIQALSVSEVAPYLLSASGIGVGLAFGLGLTLGLDHVKLLGCFKFKLLT